MLPAVKYSIANVTNFAGRDARQTFWYYVLFLFLVQIEISVVAVEPSVLRLELDHEIRKLVPIRVRLAGEPAAGSQVVEASPRPPELVVEGPATLLDTLDVLVVPVNLEGHALSFKESHVVQSPDRLIKILQSPVVTVDVPMANPDLDSTPES